MSLRVWQQQQQQPVWLLNRLFSFIIISNQKVFLFKKGQQKTLDILTRLSFVVVCCFLNTINKKVYRSKVIVFKTKPWLILQKIREFVIVKFFFFFCHVVVNYFSVEIIFLSKWTTTKLGFFFVITVCYVKKGSGSQARSCQSWKSLKFSVNVWKIWKESFQWRGKGKKIVCFVNIRIVYVLSW